MISVVIPYGRHSIYLERTREQLSKIPIQVIIVLDRMEAMKRYSNEVIVVGKKRGRGYSIVEGVKKAKGDIIMILHADTRLPLGWEKLVLKVMRNPKVVGGCFTLRFDRKSIGLKIIRMMAETAITLTKEFWGDHAVFVRAGFVKKYLNKLEVPILEDVILSHLMRRKGKVVKLKQKVITEYNKPGRQKPIRYALRVAKCRLMYTLGFKLDKIYKAYYQG